MNNDEEGLSRRDRYELLIRVFEAVGIVLITAAQLMR